MLTVRELNNGAYRVHYGGSSEHLGLIYKEVDGFYVFNVRNNNGFWDAYIMRLIADKLDEMNKDYADLVNKELKKE